MGTCCHRDCDRRRGRVHYVYARAEQHGVAALGRSIIPWAQVLLNPVSLEHYPRLQNNGVADYLDILGGFNQDCDANGIPMNASSTAMAMVPLMPATPARPIPTRLIRAFVVAAYRTPTAMAMARRTATICAPMTR